MKLLVSACLLGGGRRYDGGHNQLPQLKELLKNPHLHPHLPEQMGGPPPPPAERQAQPGGHPGRGRHHRGLPPGYSGGPPPGRPLSVQGRPAEGTQPLPACGQIYDGTFSKTLVEGDGMAAQMLKKHGLTVYGESQIGELVNTRPLLLQHLKRQNRQAHSGPAGVFLSGRFPHKLGRGHPWVGSSFPVEHCPHQGVPHIPSFREKKGTFFG